MSKYLQAVERFFQIPNFWCSEEYWEKAGWYEEETETSIMVLDDEGIRMLPVFDKPSGTFDPTGSWSSFLSPEPGDPEAFLDYNFIYNPEDFRNLDGAKWSTFRKNSKKFPNRYQRPTNYRNDPDMDISDMIVSWLDTKETVEDAETLLNYLQGSKNRWVLYSDTEVLGVNIWDENYMFVNYRYCLVNPKHDFFLSEYMRWLFYTNLSGSKKVNDGGALGSEGLFKFKQRLNPIQVYSVYTRSK